MIDMKEFWESNSKELDRAMWIVNSGMNNWNKKSFLESGKEDWKKIVEKVKGVVPDFKYVLEIGCGLCRVLCHAAKDFENVAGVDISENMLDHACKMHNILNMELFTVDGTGRLPFENNVASLIYSIICFQHIPYEHVQIAYLKEIERVLKKGGVAFLMVQDPDWAQSSGGICMGKGLGKHTLRDSIKYSEPVTITNDFIGSDGRNYWAMFKKK